MKEYYASLYRKFTENYGQTAFNSFAHFAAMRGKEYDKQESLRLMVVGRSTNGWLSYSKDFDAIAFGERMEEIFNDNENKAFDWIVSDFTNGDGYRIKKSKFWNYTEEVWEKLNKAINNPPINLTHYNNRWFEFICWSNLYKITEQGKRPGIKMTRLQTPECIMILKEEIKAYRPSVILMEIDDTWFTSFASLFSSIKQTNGSVVKITARYNKIPVIVTARPEIIQKKEFVTETTDVILKSSNNAQPYTKE